MLVLQFLIYPGLHAMVGTEAFGSILFALGIIAVFAPAIGGAVNNIQVVNQKTYTNSVEYLVIVGTYTLVAVVPLLFILRDQVHGIASGLALSGLLVLTTFRYYSDVEFRIHLNYRGFFLFYFASTVGYLLGFWLSKLTGSWELAVLLGEACAVAYVIIRGSLYRKSPFSKANVKTLFKKTGILISSYLIYNAVLNLDRVLLLYLIDSSAVTIYYVASLLGKSFALLVTPLNAIIISYLSKRDTQLTRAQFLKASVLTMVVGAGFYTITLAGTRIFVQLAYADIFQEVIALSAMANLSQIICFSGSVILIIILTIASEKWQLLIQMQYVIIFLALGIVGVNINGVQGFVAGTLVANVLRLFSIIAIGIKITGRKGVTTI